MSIQLLQGLLNSFLMFRHKVWSTDKLLYSRIIADKLSSLPSIKKLQDVLANIVGQYNNSQSICITIRILAGRILSELMLFLPEKQVVSIFPLLLSFL